MKFRLDSLTTSITEATGRYMAACYPDLPPLVWHLDDGGALTGQSETDNRAEVDVWAEALSLTAERHQTPGAHQVSGNVDDVWILVWAVVDRDVWERSDDEEVIEDGHVVLESGESIPLREDYAGGHEVRS